MRSRHLLTLMLPLLIALPVQAQVYKWKDAQGRTVISDTPQPGSGKQAPVVGRPASAGDSTGENGAATTTPTAPKTWAEKDLEFKQRQQQQRENAEKSAKEKAEADQRKEGCERAKGNLRLMESGQRISRTKADGEREFLDDQQRQQEVERARKSVQEWCK